MILIFYIIFHPDDIGGLTARRLADGEIPFSQDVWREPQSEQDSDEGIPGCGEKYSFLDPAPWGSMRLFF